MGGRISCLAVWGAVSSLLLPLVGCMVVGPNYEPTEPSLPAAYAAPVPALFRQSPSVDRWWTLFDDTFLTELIQTGLAQSPEIRVAASRVREARAIARGVAALSRPSLDASGAAEEQVRLGQGDSSSDASLNASLAGLWDLDLFGGLQRSREAALADAERQEALRREAARITVAEIARTYVDLRTTQRRLDLIERSLELQRRTLALVQQRVAAGLAPGLDEVRARAAVASLQADVGPLRSQIERLENALAVLLGQPPGSLAETLAGEAPIPAAQTGAAIGVPLDLIRRRPDIQAAELQIAAATAEVGIATADLYPRLTLPGTIGVGLTEIGTGSIAASVLSSLSLLVDLPLYDGGQRRANITAAEERVIQASLAYRQTLLGALEEVESALLGYRGTRARREALMTAVENNRLAYEQSQELYRQGFVTFIDVLDSQREWNSSLQELATAERNLSVEIINLYSAVGGAAPSL